MLINAANEYIEMPAAQAQSRYLALDVQATRLIRRLPRATDDHSMLNALGELASLYEEVAVVHHAAMTIWPDSGHEREPDQIAASLADVNDSVRVLRTLERIWRHRCTGADGAVVDLSQWPQLQRIGSAACDLVVGASDQATLARTVEILGIILEERVLAGRGAEVLVPVIAALRQQPPPLRTV